MKLWLMISVLAMIPGGVASSGYSMDEIKLVSHFNPSDQRLFYAYGVLEKALDVTVESDGPYTISYADRKMQRNRVLVELAEGVVNVHLAATRLEWEEETIPVRIPVLKGILGYRLLVVRRDDLERFKDIQDLESLKSLRAGSGLQWTTTTVLQQSGFNVVTGRTRRGLYGMLDRDRFDYFPRGVNEIYAELETMKNVYPDIRVEPSLALYFPTPSYFFVSPRNPGLADRIRRGLEILIKNGEFDAMFDAAYGEAIARAKIGNRKVLMIENMLLSPKTPFDRQELWYTPR